MQIPLKIEIDIEEAVENITKTIQKAAWEATPDRNEQYSKEERPIIIKQKNSREKAHKSWQLTRASQNKQRYNTLAKELKNLLQNLKNEGIQDNLKGLTPPEVTDYSLWKPVRKMKRPQQHIPPILLNHNHNRRDKQKAAAFAEHVASVFQPFTSQLSVKEEETINNDLNVLQQKTLPLKKIRINEVKNFIQYKINPKKAPGYDLTEYFPCQWKVGQIIMIVKPGKNPNDITSYRPINLFPILSKILEEVFLKLLTPIIDESKLMPSHLFAFRKEQRTIEQGHRLVYKIKNDLEK